MSAGELDDGRARTRKLCPFASPRERMNLSFATIPCRLIGWLERSRPSRCDAQFVSFLNGKRRVLRFMITLVTGLVASLNSVAVASAQTYPQRAVKFILPFGPAAGVDISARLLGEKLAARWGKPVVIENRPGGDGLVAINAFTSSNDEHTLLFVPASTFTAHPYTHEKLPYDAERDLLPITNVTTIVIALSAPASLNVKTLGEFIALARAKPNTLNVAAAAGNSDLILSAFIKTQGLPVARVPYRDIQQAPSDLAEARIHLLMSSYATMLPLVQAGSLRILAVTSRKRVGIARRYSNRRRSRIPISRTRQSDWHIRAARNVDGAARKHCRRRPYRH